MNGKVAKSINAYFRSAGFKTGRRRMKKEWSTYHPDTRHAVRTHLDLLTYNVEKIVALSGHVDKTAKTWAPNGNLVKTIGGNDLMALAFVGDDAQTSIYLKWNGEVWTQTLPATRYARKIPLNVDTFNRLWGLAQLTDVPDAVKTVVDEQVELLHQREG